MGKNFTKEQKEVYVRYQPILSEACASSRRFEATALRLQEELRTGVK